MATDKQPHSIRMAHLPQKSCENGHGVRKKYTQQPSQPERMKVIQGYKKMILEPDEKQRKHNLFSILFERLSVAPKPYEDYIFDKVCKKIARLDRISRVEGTFILKVFGFYLAHFSASIPNSSSYEWRYVIFGEGSVSDED